MTKKLLLKVCEQTPFGNKIEKWVHVCYVDSQLHKEILEKYPAFGNQFNELLSRWCMEDFQVRLNMTTWEDLLLLRELVKKHYKDAYPDIYNPSETDRQGWMRVWVTKKMKEEIYGKESV
jgi:hypothetical protein